MNRPTRWHDLITINILFLGLTMYSQTNGLVFPLLIQQFIGEGQKAASLGSLRLWTLMVALLMQAVWGMISDHGRLRFGRRRPFILVGAMFTILFGLGIGYSVGMSGQAGFRFLFVMAILSQVASNMAQAAQQGLIPDLAPEKQRGKFSAVKAVLELPVPLILVSFTAGSLISSGRLFAGIAVALGILALSMVTAMFAPETPPEHGERKLNWGPIVRLAGMTTLFTLTILGSGQMVRLAGSLLSGTSSSAARALGMGAVGFLSMLVAVALGVYLSIRVSLGQSSGARDAAGRPLSGASTSSLNTSFTWWVINRLAFLVGAVNLSTFAVYFIQARLGYERESAAGPASILMLLVGVFILLSALPSGWLSDRFGRKPVLLASGLLAAGGTLLLLLFPSLLVIYIGGCMIGVGTGLFYTANWALGADLVPPREAGRYLGISNLAGAGAGAVGAYIGGPIADYFTQQTPEFAGLGYIVLFAIYGLLFFFSILALARIHAPGEFGEAVPEGSWG